MNSLSIIIHQDEQELKGIFELIKPLIVSFDTELIIISNTQDTFDISYDYTILNYNNDYHTFKEYCIYSSISKRIMVIDKGYKITPELIASVNSELQKDDYKNISINLKTYLSEDKKLSYTREEVIIYNRGVQGFNHNLDLTIEDISLIKLDNMDRTIELLIEKNHYKELLLWYKYNILNKVSNIQSRFYDTIEKIKYIMDINSIQDLEKTFIDSEIDNDYTHYIKIKHMKTNKENQYYSGIKNSYKTINSQEKIYYSWFIYDYIKDNMLPDFLLSLNDNLKEKYLNYILDNINNCENHLYQLLINYNNKVDKSSIYKLRTYILLLENYMDYMSNKSETPLIKSKLIKIHDIYILSCNEWGKNNDLLNNHDIRFLDLFNQAHELVDKGLIDESINQLMTLSKKYPKKAKILNYYIQRLRYKYNVYPYTLSICMIVKNESKNIDRCLKSLKPLVDSNLAEIIIVDTGSEDNTIEIAKNYTKNIFYYTWTGNFSDARNYCNLFARGEYIFTMDADEELMKDETEKLINIFTNTNYLDYNTYTLTIISYTDIELTKFSGLTQSRIFRNNNRFYYTSAIHNQAVINEPIKNLDISITHYGYIMTEDIKEKKFQRTSSLLKKELEGEPRNLYYRYQLSTSYGMYGDVNNAIRQVDIFMNIINENKLINDITIMYLNNAAAIYCNGYKFEKANKVIDTALMYKPDFIDFIYYKAYVLFNLGKYSEALPYIEKYLLLLKDYFESNIAKDGRYVFYTLGYKSKAVRLYIVMNYRLKNYLNCIDYAYGIDNDLTLKNCLHEIVNSCFYTKRYKELVDFYDNKINQSKQEGIEDVFLFFLIKNLVEMTDVEIDKLYSYFNDETHNNFIIKVKNQLSNNQYNTINNCLNIIEQYDIDGMDLEGVKHILLSVLPIFSNEFDYSDTILICKIKRAAMVILHRTNELMDNGILIKEQLVNIFSSYIRICIELIKLNKCELLENRENIFVTKIVNAFNENIENVDYGLKLAEKAIIQYPEMNDIIELVTKPLQHSQCTDNTTKSDNIILDDDSIKNRIKANLINNNFAGIEKTTCTDSCLRVLMGTSDPTGKTINLRNILNHNGINAKTLNYIPNYNLMNPDYVLDIYKFTSDEKLLNSLIDIASQIIPLFDIFHFNYLSSLTINNIDLSILIELNKKLFLHLWDKEVSITSKAVEYNPYINIDNIHDDNIKRSLEATSKYIPNCIISNMELQNYVSDFFDTVNYISPMIDIEKYINLPFYNYNRERNKKFTIACTPSATKSKGIRYILKAIEELKLRYEIVLLQMQELSYENKLIVYGRADLVIDEITTGNYSQHAIEAMALEKPVICWINDFMKDIYPSELPIINSRPENIKEVIAEILCNKDMLKSIGKKGRDYITKYHNSNIEVKKLIELYKK
ncbi:glycosyltransferase [Vallitalea guaymasensis]|uniref:glycosyltransferase n=1 Tax=Vallitalea guaymasensis TaxID=1185412 RepID=UPI00272BCF72|nr:glycosyltransferase [Vallitalea guaymasensis]